MDRYPVSRWDGDGPMSLAAIRARHQPASHFRISVYRFPPATQTTSIMRAGLCYVLAGRCRIESARRCAEVAAGDVVELPADHHRFIVIGGEGLEVVKCWELPPELWLDN